VVFADLQLFAIDFHISMNANIYYVPLFEKKKNLLTVKVNVFRGGSDVNFCGIYFSDFTNNKSKLEKPAPQEMTGDWIHVPEVLSYV